MPIFTDQVGRNVNIPAIPKRIISLVPSQTELLSTLGLEEAVTGITKFCMHPDNWFRTKTRVGGTKQLKMEVIHSLKPDLIIANKEENTKEQIEELEKQYPVWVSDVNNLADAIAMIAQIGIITGKEEKSKAIILQIETNFYDPLILDSKLNAAYLIWYKPYMAAGGDTFINDMLQIAGFSNVFKSAERYPEVSIEQIKESGAEVVLLSSEPFPFHQKHIEELQAALPGVKTLLVDGEMFSWYGSRLLHAPAYFKELRQRI